MFSSANGEPPRKGDNEDLRQNPTSRDPAAVPDRSSRIAMNAQSPESSVLSELRSGKRGALDQLIPLVYQELRAIAHRQLAARAAHGTLSTTALVHEAYLKLVDQSRADWRDRAHFLAVASLAMRHVLVDRAKARSALKRGGTRRRITLDDAHIAVDDQPDALLQLDEAMNRLAELQPRLARVVECRFFGGLTEEEFAEALGVTVRTVQRDWAKAKMLLQRELES
jgi:RNA polymerase sigma factor (TIGR02999 family)